MIDVSFHELLSDCNISWHEFRTLKQYQLYKRQWAPVYRPDDELMQKISQFIKQGKGNALEVGARQGLWGELYRRYNLNQQDSLPWICTEWGISKYQPLTTRYCEDALTAIDSWSRSQTLICILPNAKYTYAADALKAFRGTQLIYIGGDRCPCGQANPLFYDRLYRHWRLIEAFPQPYCPSVGPVSCQFYVRC